MSLYASHLYPSTRHSCNYSQTISSCEPLLWSNYTWTLGHIYLVFFLLEASQHHKNYLSFNCYCPSYSLSLQHVITNCLIWLWQLPPAGRENCGSGRQSFLDSPDQNWKAIHRLHDHWPVITESVINERSLVSDHSLIIVGWTVTAAATSGGELNQTRPCSISATAFPVVGKCPLHNVPCSQNSWMMHWYDWKQS